MANGSNEESILLVVTPQAIEEPEVGLAPQMQTQPVAFLFSDRRILLMPRNTTGTSRVLWVQTKKLGNILLPWPNDCMNLIIVQKIVKWKYGIGWVAQWN